MFAGKTLNEYFEKYGALHGAKAIEVLNPVYVPGRDESLDLSFVSKLDPKRKPYPAQANVINAVAKAWQDTMIICGEMGTGKTLLGAAAIHANAVHRGLKGYRALIMAPNHLIDKWIREIYMTVPGSKVYRFEQTNPNKADDSYKAVAKYIAERKGGHGKGGRALWAKPDHPEWVIVGRNQAKQDCSFIGLGEMGYAHEPGVLRWKAVGEQDVKDADGRPVWVGGKVKKKAVMGKVPMCPKCGQQVHLPLSTLWEERHYCKSLYLVQVVSGDRHNANGLDRISPIPDDHAKHAYPGQVVKIEKNRYRVVECNEPLWQFFPKPRKWAPAKLFHRQGRLMFDYFILDEMHEEKGVGTGQAIAAGKLMKSAKKVMGLTGTLIGGYAHHLFSLLMRMSPSSLVSEGFKWGEGEGAFSNVYGRIDTTIVTKVGERTVTRGNKKRGQTSIKVDYDGDSTERRDVKPGIMPTFFGKHLLDKAVFISLDEMSADLPPLIDDDRSLVSVSMDPDLDFEFKNIQNALVAKNDELLRKGSSKLLSAMLHTLLEYPDKPFGWVGPFPDEDAVGYFAGTKKNQDSWQGVIQPADLDEEVVYAKEQALFDLCYREHQEGRQVWVYCTQTGKRDVQTRLAGMFTRGGLRCKIMRSAAVKTYDRERWIAEHGPSLDVIFSHPELVSTGLDFFDSAGTFNFCTIIFYEGDYRVNLIRQAGRRHWRIGQTKECRTYYLYYSGTMQERQVAHCGDKYAAAKSLEGKFSAEGLAAMSSGGMAMVEMAKALEKQIEDPRKSWAKLRDETKARLIRMDRDGSLATLASAVFAKPILTDAARMLLESPDNFSLLDEIDPDSLQISDAEYDLLNAYDPSLDAIMDSLKQMGLDLDTLV